MSSQPAGKTIVQPNSPCPCGSGRIYAECCSPILQQQRRADTAEELMRSRFTAHAVHDNAHLHRTFLTSARLPYPGEPEGDDEALAWTRLVVHSHEVGPKPDSAFVDFSAYFRDDNGEHAIQEKSEFQRIDGEWFYTRAVRSGPAPVKSAGPKLGRNEPCSCGSGKKYKHCCLARA